MAKKKTPEKTQPVKIEANKDLFFAVKKIVEEKNEKGKIVEVEVTEYPNIPVVVVNNDEESF